MDARIGAVANELNNFEPSSDLIREEECDTLLVYLPGFTKEQLRVQLAKSGILKISGARPIGGAKWSRFQKDFPVSKNTDTSKITAKFEGGILYVRQPKLIVPAKKEEQKVPPSETPQPRTPAKEQPAPPKTDQEQANTEKTTPTDDENWTRDTKEERQSTEEKEKSHEPEDERKDEKNNVHGKTNKIGDQKDAERSKRKNDDELAHKAKAAATKLIAESPAAKLKMARQQMTMVLAVLFALALGIYISNLGWFSRKAEN